MKDLFLSLIFDIHKNILKDFFELFDTFIMLKIIKRNLNIITNVNNSIHECLGLKDKIPTFQLVSVNNAEY